MIFLAIVSPTSNIKVPTRAAVGINVLCLGPTSFLAICGDTNPKNAILPATEVATPASITANIISFLREQKHEAWLHSLMHLNI